MAQQCGTHQHTLRGDKRVTHPMSRETVSRYVREYSVVARQRTAERYFLDCLVDEQSLNKLNNFIRKIIQFLTFDFSSTNVRPLE